VHDAVGVDVEGDLDLGHATRGRRQIDELELAQGLVEIGHLALALDHRGEPHGIRAFSLHPGRIETALQRHITIAELQAQGFRDKNGQIPDDQRALYKTPQQGAATTIWCATSPALAGMGGVYCENADIAQAVPADHQPLDGVLPWAMDPDAAERLWTLSEAMTGSSLR